MLKEFIDNILKELNVEGLEGDERYEVTAQIVDHFQEVIIETVMANLNVEQLKQFKELIEESDEQKLDEGISALVAQIPGINFKIDEAIAQELETLKRAKKIIDN